MAITKSKKQELLSFLQNEVAEQKAVLFLTTENAEESLTAEKNTEFRKVSRQEGIILKMFKITLLKQAFESFPNDISGQIYVAFVENQKSVDEVYVPKQIVKTLSDKFGANLKVVGSYVNGEFLDEGKTKELSKVPSFDDSMAMLAGGINQISTQIARLIKEIPTTVARGVLEVQKTK